MTAPTSLTFAAWMALGILAVASSGCSPEPAAGPAIAPALTAATKPAVKPTVEREDAARPAASTTFTAAPEKDAAPPKRPSGKQPKADRLPTRPGEAEKITFEDLILGMQADVVFRPFMLSERAKELDGKRVSIAGYMHAGASGKRIKEFVLLRNTECKFGKGGQADHLAQVFLKEGETTDYQLESIKVEGKLKIEPFEGFDGNTWAIYRLEDAVVK